MIRVTEDQIRHMEASYPGIAEQIQRFEAMELPPCPVCGSADTASVRVGIIGRTINLNAACSKVHFMLNANGKGIYFCNVCRQQFGPAK